MKSGLIVGPSSGGHEETRSIFVCDYLKGRSLKHRLMLCLNEIQVILIGASVGDISLALPFGRIGG